MSARADLWSRRRAAVAAERRAEVEAQEAESLASRQADLADRPEDEVLAQLGLPSPESVCSGDDLRGFMAKAVPEYLRRRALRTLWRSNPVLACLDGLNDYDGDFTNAATDAPGVKTAYRVGKGLQAHLDALMEAKRAPGDEEGAVEAAVVADAQPDAEADQNSDDKVAPADPAPVRTAEAPDDDQLAAPRPRRMAFQFDGTAT